ncbi:Methyltransferase type 12 [Catenulispora acidiphila DSM 44928]|uniref:Methyltransferase type 12 n=1 Tax=Catenulispora acidiphila (strain DSM 44928 / JCM 14897 / NBRC 102108 / NRRL B-24433 / ID139908) TaxID=479433 RepID=C7QDW6_CATAD|nr:class I SAM-dependent methyltransferase [Catenulispora acidiphila]ACU76554.1 Methyltransferase type 12 [Catenulispora acidiphila DSM 44928]
MSAETTAPDPGNWLEYNRANWDERVPIHVDGTFYDLAGFVAGRETLEAFELAEVGDVHGKSLLHLQSHIGTETLGWARHGAVVTGLDFSGAAMEAAAALADRIGVAGSRWVTSNVYDAAEALGGEQFDVVYTGKGALCWLPDIERWARVAASTVKPGGFLYVSEFHPFGNTLDDESGRTVAYDYFDRSPQVWDEPGTYADFEAPTEKNVSVEFSHGIGEIVSSLIGAGLRLEFLHEFDMTLFQRFRALERRDGVYRLPEGTPRVPLMFSLRAAKPE